MRTSPLRAILRAAMPQTLSDIKAMLGAQGLHPKHRLGQNFLHDHNQMRTILQTAAIRPGELVLEIGAGTGALSELLLDAGARVVAVELDRDLEPLLRARLQDRFGPQVRLLVADALAGKHHINPLVLDALAALGNVPGPEPPPFTMVANLPYSVACPLIATLCLEHRSMRSAVVLLQREVAQRLNAGPGTKAYGPLGIMVQAVCRVQCIATVPPGCFWPRPKVHSVLVRLDRRTRPLTDDTRALGTLVSRLFQQRRKQLGRILGREAPLPEGVDPTARPEELSVAQLVDLSARAG